MQPDHHAQRRTCHFLFLWFADDVSSLGLRSGSLSLGFYKLASRSSSGKCLFLSGLTDQQLNYSHDQTLPQNYGIGFTNMVERTTPGSKDLSR